MSYSSVPVKRHLDGGTDGMGIAVTTSGNLICTATTETADGFYSEIWLWATNNSGANANVTLMWGSTNLADMTTKTIAPQDGDYLLIKGKILRNSKLVKASASVGSAITISGFINLIREVSF